MTTEEIEIFNILKATARYSDPRCGEWLYDVWMEHNTKFFDGSLYPVVLLFALIPHGQALASYNGLYRRSYIHQCLLETRTEGLSILPDILCRRLASDMVLHNCIHQKVWQVYGPTGHLQKKKASHNNPYFVAEINRIAPMIGLEANAAVLRQKRINGKAAWYVPPDKLARASMALWPASVRPPDYFNASERAILRQYRITVRETYR